MTDYNVDSNPSRMAEFKERLREKLVMEEYYKTLSKFPSMNQTDAMLHASTCVKEKADKGKALEAWHRNKTSEQEVGNT